MEDHQKYSAFLNAWGPVCEETFQKHKHKILYFVDDACPSGARHPLKELVKRILPEEMLNDDSLRDGCPLPWVAYPQWMAAYFVADIQLTSGQVIKTLYFPQSWYGPKQWFDSKLNGVALLMYGAFIVRHNVFLEQAYLAPRLGLLCWHFRIQPDQLKEYIVRKSSYVCCSAKKENRSFQMNAVNDLLLHAAEYLSFEKLHIEQQQPFTNLHWLRQQPFEMAVCRWIDGPWQQKRYVAEVVIQDTIEKRVFAQRLQGFNRKPLCWSCHLLCSFVGVFCLPCAKQYSTWEDRINIIICHL